LEGIEGGFFAQGGAELFSGPMGRIGGSRTFPHFFAHGLFEFGEVIETSTEAPSNLL
jgi:hypothetical protein